MPTRPTRAATSATRWAAAARTFARPRARRPTMGRGAGTTAASTSPRGSPSAGGTAGIRAAWTAIRPTARARSGPWKSGTSDPSPSFVLAPLVLVLAPPLFKTLDEVSPHAGMYPVEERFIEVVNADEEDDIAEVVVAPCREFQLDQLRK